MLLQRSLIQMFERMLHKYRRRNGFTSHFSHSTRFIVLENNKSLAHKPSGCSNLIMPLPSKACVPLAPLHSLSHLQYSLSREWLLHTSNRASLIPEIATVQGLQKPHKYQFPGTSSLQLHSCIRHGSITALFHFPLLIPCRGKLVLFAFWPARWIVSI